MSYELYYWGACGEFYGRALSPLLIFGMLKTKAVAALKGKGKKLMPGEHNKAW